MRKGERTKEKIVAQTAPLFNRKGFAGASVADIMELTGLRKGGIYNHFATKDELALEAFDYSVARIRERLDAALEGKTLTADRLIAMAGVFAEHIVNPAIPGGCPLLNTAVDSDDTHPQLRQRVLDAMERWHTLVRGTVRKGIARGEIRSDVDPDSFSTLFIASLEGGVMLSKLYGDTTHMDLVVEFLSSHIRSIASV